MTFSLLEMTVAFAVGFCFGAVLFEKIFEKSDPRDDE